MELYKSVIRRYLSEYACSPREKRGLTQAEMAERLRITERAYSDLERGVYCFSTVPLVSLLLMLTSDEFEEFIEPLRGEIAKLEAGEVA